MYDYDYFENGVIKGVSGYMYYRWMPEMTLRMAHFLIRELGLNVGDRVLDFGCAKGFFVNALNILDIDAFGVDISEYAIEHAHPDVQHKCQRIESSAQLEDLFEKSFDWVLSKDVLEHLLENDIREFLRNSCAIGQNMFIAVPLADDSDNGKFIIPSYHLDKTHVTIKPFDWWATVFEQEGWSVQKASRSFHGMKDNWQAENDQGNGFYWLQNTTKIQG